VARVNDQWKIIEYNGADIFGYKDGGKLLTAIDGEPEFDTPLKIKGKLYSARMSDLKEKAFIVKSFEDKEEDETLLEENIVCPVCGYEDRDSFEINDYDDEYECPTCHSILETQREVEVTYSAKLVRKYKAVSV
jgi:ferredoxin-like protein FixX